ncbi:MAG: carboxylesterase family protein [Bacteroidota bacterium]|nr:carboxylesterase family protein [Bacteroidota bacterium]
MTTHESAKKDTAPCFNAPAGFIIGWHDQGVIRATGIRYAYANRFQPPVPIPPAQEPIMATTWAPACPQPAVPPLNQVLGGSPIAHLETDEHCQRLSITLPANAPSEGLPVMVWIHGGSYTSGAGDATVFDPKALVMEQQVIVVSITYRLGLFGFLGGYSHRAANLGLLDIIEAIRWVKINISAFGGDPNNVTLFGHSAGGDAVAHLMIAEGTENLFQRVIIQSAPLGISTGRRKMTEAMAKMAARVPDDAIIEEIIAQQATISSVTKKFGLKAGMPFGTQYGHAPLPNEHELETAWLRCSSRYDVLIGFTAEETSLFLPRMKLLQRVTKLPLIGKIIKSLLVRITTKKVYADAARQFAKRHAKGGGRVYLYKITWGSKTNDFGATHTIDLPLLFGDKETWQKSELTKGIPWSEIQHHGQEIRALWAQFARSGQLKKKVLLKPGFITCQLIEE